MKAKVTSLENGIDYFLFDVYTKQLVMVPLHGIKWVFGVTKKASLSHSYLRSLGVNAPLELQCFTNLPAKQALV